jgi:hypothetical protein
MVPDHGRLECKNSTSGVPGLGRGVPILIMASVPVSVTLKAGEVDLQLSLEQVRMFLKQKL